MLEFLRKNKYPIIIIFIIGLFAYSVKLFTYSISIDTEILIYTPEKILDSWIAIGRWALVGTKQLFHFIPINIYLTNIFTFLIFFISIIFWFINFDKLFKKDNKFAKTVFGLIIITAPIFAEQFYFSLQSVEVAIAFLEIAVAVYFQEKWITENKIWAIFPTIILVTLSFGCYQAFIPLYISICVFDYIVKYNEKVDIKRILKYLLIFILSFGINIIIDKIFKNVNQISDNGYLFSQIAWGTERKINTIQKIALAIKDTFLGNGIHETIAYGVIFILMTLVVSNKIKFKENKFFYLVYIFFFVISPFITVIIKGTPEVVRARFATPFVTGFAFYYVLINQENKEILNMAKIVAIYTIIVQTIITFLLFYSDYQRYCEDVNIANKISEDLEKLDITKPIYIMNSFNSQNLLLKGDGLGESFFIHDSNSEIGCTGRAIKFMKILGNDKINRISAEQVPEARKELEEKILNEEIDLKAYPEEGYIIELDDYIIVNF